MIIDRGVGRGGENLGFRPSPDRSLPAAFGQRLLDPRQHRPGLKRFRNLLGPCQVTAGEIGTTLEKLKATQIELDPGPHHAALAELRVPNCGLKKAPRPDEAAPFGLNQERGVLQHDPKRRLPSS